MSKKYDVALSFAGEDRQYAKELADLLDAGKYSVFYDEYELAKLWGENLYEKLSENSPRAAFRAVDRPWRQAFFIGRDALGPRYFEPSERPKP